MNPQAPSIKGPPRFMVLVRASSKFRSFGILAFCVMLPLFALAEDFGESVKQLKEAKDFRVRTQAALTLGSSGKAEAVRPLCGALGDENRTVRIASATALAKLGRGGIGCLRDRREKESDQAVVSSIDRALATLDDAVPIGQATKFYVALERLSGSDRLDTPIRSAMVKILKGQSHYAIAPRGESTDEATKLLAKKTAVRGVLLSPKVGKAKYEGTKLEVKLQIAIMSYPGRAIIADYTQKMASEDVSGPDPKLEDELLASAAEAAAERFLKLAPNLDL